jgi:hypothetical protein
MLDLAKTRIANTLRLFEEFKDTNSPGVAPLWGLEKAFSAHLQISAAQWSQLKGGHRSIGATLARQFESRCGKPGGWLDERHAPGRGSVAAAPLAVAAARPRDAEERFAVELFLIAYRANPQEVKSRLLDLVHGELAKSPKPQIATPLRIAATAKNPCHC